MANVESAMEIDSEPTTRSADHNNSLPSLIKFSPSGLPLRGSGELMSMAEFEAQFPIREDEPSPVQTNSTPMIKPLPVAQTTGEYVAKFNNLCQQHGFVPHFTLHEIAKGCFSARVEFSNVVCEAPGPYPSKRQAKDSVAEEGLDILSARKIPKKRKASDPDSPNVKRKTLEDEENWVGILVEFCQKKKCGMPLYTSYEANMRAQQLAGLITNPKQFAQTVQLHAVPGQVFGSEESLFTTKNEAKKSAAKEAVLYLRANDILQASSSPKPAKPSTPDQQAKLVQSMAKMSTNQSISQLVHDRSLQLGLSSPRYDTKPGKAPEGAIAPNFYTASASYQEQDVQREPALKGTLCQTEVVFGQKRAKELCSKELLGVLDRLVALRAGECAIE